MIITPFFPHASIQHFLSSPPRSNTPPSRITLKRRRSNPLSDGEARDVSISEYEPVYAHSSVRSEGFGSRLRIFLETKGRLEVDLEEFENGAASEKCYRSV